MKKLLFSAYTLDIGGIETSLVNLLNTLISKYEITLILEKKQGIFLKEIDNRVKIIEYAPNQNKNVLIRKTINLFKRLKFIFKYKNRFDFACSYTTYSLMSSFCSRIASKNNALWVHSDYMQVYKKDINKMVKFFEFIKYKKFNKFIFVSNASKNSFKKVFNMADDKLIKINNIINHTKILEKSLENIDMKKDQKVTTFLNVSRHDEESKKLTRLIEAAKILHAENYKFKILFVGEGTHTDLYKSLVDKYNLENIIVFLGSKENPYPYFKISDAIVLTSDYEGYPVVFTESLILGLPIITTDVSDSKQDIDKKFGIVTSKNVDSICNTMKQILNKDITFNINFNAEKFNNDILEKLEKLF